MRRLLLTVCLLTAGGCQSGDPPTRSGGLGAGGTSAEAIARLPVTTSEDVRRAFEQNPTAATRARIRRNQDHN